MYDNFMAGLKVGLSLAAYVDPVKAVCLDHVTKCVYRDGIAGFILEQMPPTGYFIRARVIISVAAPFNCYG
jgi:hypothetical protein